MVAWWQKWVGTGTRRMPALLAEAKRWLRWEGSSSAGPTEVAEGANLVTSNPQLYSDLLRFGLSLQFLPA